MQGIRFHPRPPDIAINYRPSVKTVPLFPLGVVLYPGETLPLHIFEDRYHALVRHCLETESPFGIVLVRDDEMEDIGCTALIRNVVDSLEDGRSDIVVEGGERFRVREIIEREPFLSAAVEEFGDRSDVSSTDMTERLIAQHIKLLEVAGRTPSPSRYEGRDPISYFIAHNAGLTLEQKQDILELRAESERVEYLVRHLEAFIPAVEEAESIRRKIRTNGHFKDFPPEE
ncbi:MAG: LON peptidase substrate-binding domain-containing protein [Rhodothermales bacterium]|nr:LON peptidase substrate-binding domain-containing protein [Rhodothermales bacterium]